MSPLFYTSVYRTHQLCSDKQRLATEADRPFEIKFLALHTADSFDRDLISKSDQINNGDRQCCLIFKQNTAHLFPVKIITFFLISLKNTLPQVLRFTRSTVQNCIVTIQ